MCHQASLPACLPAFLQDPPACLLTSLRACLPFYETRPPACLPAEDRELALLRDKALRRIGDSAYNADILNLRVQRDSANKLKFLHPITGALIGPYIAADYVSSRPPQSLRLRYKGSCLLTSSGGEDIKQGRGLVGLASFIGGDSFKPTVGCVGVRGSGQQLCPSSLFTTVTPCACIMLQGIVLTPEQAAERPADEKLYHTVIAWPGVPTDECFVLVPDEPFRYINSADDSSEQNIMMWSSSPKEVVMTVTAPSIPKGKELLAYYRFAS